MDQQSVTLCTMCPVCRGKPVTPWLQLTLPPSVVTNLCVQWPCTRFVEHKNAHMPGRPCCVAWGGFHKAQPLLCLPLCFSVCETALCLIWLAQPRCCVWGAALLVVPNSWLGLHAPCKRLVTMWMSRVNPVFFSWDHA